MRSTSVSVSDDVALDGGKGMTDAEFRPTLDIAAGSIADAKARAASERLRYSAKFYVLDCFNVRVWRNLGQNLLS